MVKLIILSVAAILAAWSGKLHAEELEATNRPLERVKFVRSRAMPDAMFFRQFLRLVTRFEDGHDMDDAVRLTQSKIGFAEFGEALEFYQFLVHAKAQMLEDHNAQVRKLLCPLESPRPGGRQVFQVMDALDDHWDTLGGEHLTKLLQRLDTRQAKNLQTWISELKAKTVFMRFDHAQRYKGENPDLVRQEVCGRFDSRISASQ